MLRNISSFSPDPGTTSVSRVGLPIAGMLLIVAAASDLLAGERPADRSGAPLTVGVPWTGDPGVREQVADIMARPPLAHVAHEGIEHEAFDRGHLPQNPESQASNMYSRAADQPGAGMQATPTASWTIGRSFLGAQHSESRLRPPDSMGDVGLDQILVFVNGRLRLFSKATGEPDPTLNTTPNAFFASVNPDNWRVGDPRVRFDRLSGRWFLLAATFPSPLGANRILVAVSDDAAIRTTSSFTFYSFVQNLPPPQTSATYWADYPSLGIDNNALYVGANVFEGPSAIQSDCFVVRKSSLLAGSLVVTAFRRVASYDAGEVQVQGPESPQGVDNDDPTANAGYFIGIDNTQLGSLVLRRVDNPGATPTLSENLIVTVPATQPPIRVPTRNGMPLWSMDDRLFQARVHKGPSGRRLWTAHNIQVDAEGVASDLGGRNGARWYELSVEASPTLVQAGTLFDNAAAPGSYFFPSCSATGQGHMGMASSFASINDYAGVAVSGHLLGDPPGVSQPPSVIQPGEASYPGPPDCGSSCARWGDYSATSVDPEDDMTLWTFQEYANTPPPPESWSWAVRVIELKAPPPATPTAASPSRVCVGQSDRNVTVTGASAGGSGFFDPGPSYRKRASAVVSGGIPATSLSVTDPTHVTLRISTLGAAAGRRSVTVVNPDGQAAAGTILDVGTESPGTGNNGPVCAGDTLQLTASSIAGATYSWTGPNGFVSPSQNPALPNATPAAAGMYSVVATADGCASNAASTVVTVLPRPAVAIVSPDSVAINSTGNAASVTGAGPGASYRWDIGNGTITVGQGTSSIVFTAGRIGPVTLKVTVTDPSSCPASARRDLVLTGVPPLRFFAVPPCRLVDTRDPDGPTGGPSLLGSMPRSFPVAGEGARPCGVPLKARAVAVTVAAVLPNSPGHLTLYPAEQPTPLASTLNFNADGVRASNAIIPISLESRIAVLPVMAPLPSGTPSTDFVLDITGYFATAKSAGQEE